MATLKRIISAEEYAFELTTKKVEKLETDMTEVLEKFNPEDLRQQLAEAQEVITGVKAMLDANTVIRDVIDTLYPIGTVIFKHNSDSPSNTTGMSHTVWEKLSTGRYIKTCTSSPGQTGGGTTTGSSSVTTNTSTTGECKLSVQQLPPHTHNVTTSGAGGAIGTIYTCQANSPSGIVTTPNTKPYEYNVGTGNVTGTIASVRFENATITVPSHQHVSTCGSTGGNGGSDAVGHTHTIPALSSPGHSHSMEPTYLQLIAWQRIQ